VRLDYCQRGTDGNGGIEGIAALIQHLKAGLGGQWVSRGNRGRRQPSLSGDTQQ
jgi:hypothetical protein